MKANESVPELVERALDEVTLADDFHVKQTARGPVRRLVFAQYVEGEGTGVHVAFTVDSDDLDQGTDPEVQALAARALDELRRIHPELERIPIRVTFG